MAGLDTTDRGSLSALPQAPVIPRNVGKLDVGAIYDRVAQALQLNQALTNAPLSTAANAAQAGTAIAKAGAERQALPSQTQATIAENTAATQQAPMKTRLFGSQVNRATGTEQSDIAAKNAANNEAKLQSDLNSIYTNAGIQYGPEQANAVAKAKSNLITKINATPGGLFNEPVTGPNGTPIGSVIGYMGPNGPEVHAMPIPYGQMARIGTGVKYLPLGVVPDPQTGQPLYDSYQEVTTNAAGGITRGNVIQIAHGAPAPGDIFNSAAGPLGGTGTAPLGQGAAPASAGASTQANPIGTGTPAQQAGTIPSAGQTGTTIPGGRLGAQMQADQAKERLNQRTKYLEDLAAQRDSLNQTKFSIGKLTKDVADQQASPLGSGILSGLLAKTPLNTAGGRVNADLSNFVGQVMSSARNIRTQREFNAFTGAIPSASDQPQVQNDKIKFLTAANQTLISRNEYQDKLLRDNPTMDPGQAEAAAIKAIPFPDPPGGWGASTAEPATGASVAPTTAPTNTTNVAPASSATPSVPQNTVNEAVGVTPEQARKMPGNVSFYIIGGPLGPNGRPIVYHNPDPAAAQATPVAQ